MTDKTTTTTIPAGWKLVPEDATDAMVAAAIKCDWTHEDEAGTVHDVYHSMICAAPSPAPAAPSAAQWLPIETAPKDGTRIDVWLGDDEFPMRRTDVYWGRPHHECGEAGSLCDSCPPDRDMWCDDMSYGEPEDLNPTHWMPIAAAPGAQPAQDSLTETAKRMAWAYWLSLDTLRPDADRDRAWDHLTEAAKEAWLSAARAAQPVGEVVEELSRLGLCWDAEYFPTLAPDHEFCIAPENYCRVSIITSLEDTATGWGATFEEAARAALRSGEGR